MTFSVVVLYIGYWCNTVCANVTDQG